MAEILATLGDSVEATLPPGDAGPESDVSWQQALKRAVRSGKELCRRLEIDGDLASAAAETDFPVFAPQEYVRRMRKGDTADPLLRQVLGRAAEISPEAGGLDDPVGDLPAELLPGLLQKYDRRCLMIVSSACAIHCRYCFRRNFPYQSAPKHRRGWQPALHAIEQDRALDEVILSGGDPLSVSDENLCWLVGQLAGMPHIRRVRVHTRFPVVIPQRVCQALLQWVQRSDVSMYFVLHFNHVAEIDTAVCAALRRLRGAGATLLNQAVMLRGVNDSFEAQRDLNLALVDQHVLPYYLHQLDPVRGGMHFGVADSLAISIVDALRAHLPGYAVPRLVRELAGRRSKTPVLDAVALP